MNEVLREPSLYCAHKREVGENDTLFETLEEHTILCQKYFLRICRNKCIEKSIQKFLKKWMGDCSVEACRIAEEMWCNVITFHDMGKCNPNFQRVVLGRKEVAQNNRYNSVGSEHSAMSAVLYMNYYYKRIKKVGGEEGKQLCLLMVCNAYVISRHHSGFVSVQEFLKSILDGRNRGILKIFQEESKNVCLEDLELNQKIIEKLLDLMDKNGQNQSREQGIWLYFYEKLIYSMLVASDYYATSEFMSGVEIKDLGELDSISDFFQLYQNTEVSKAIRQYEGSTYPMDLERLKEKKEINILRNEIFLEAEKELLKEREKNIFYLEAPTGSGKSNISMNLSFQLAMKDKKLKKIYYICFLLCTGISPR